ncbi:hypothetical protein K7432_005558 [Basidiobolus ranarum]|uniref:RING-type domain-containing protein n=1 Tax=Basidiobolus ranarum TaxID=34480 RepID=A0ABR2W370_9FUNG
MCILLYWLRTLYTKFLSCVVLNPFSIDFNMSTLISITSLLFAPLSLLLYIYQSSQPSDFEEDDFFDMYLTGNPQSGYNSLVESDIPGCISLAEEMIKRLPLISDRECAKTKCAICHEEFENKQTDYQMRRMPCGHAFHQDCLLPWLQRVNSCPLCRRKINVDI